MRRSHVQEQIDQARDILAQLDAKRGTDDQR
jgi:hypothetical protein